MGVFGGGGQQQQAVGFAAAVAAVQLVHGRAGAVASQGDTIHGHPQKVGGVLGRVGRFQEISRGF